MMIATIAGRELRSLFLSPLAWVILAVVQGLCAWFFLLYLDLFLQLQPRIAASTDGAGVTSFVATPLYSSAAIVLLLVVPLLSMRLVSEERRARTLSLLLSAPVSMTEIILGKFLGLFIFMLIMLTLIAAMSLSLLAGGSLDLGLLASGLVGLVLLIASFCSIGLLISTLTAQPVVAAMGTFGVLLMLWILDLASANGNASGEVMSYLSMLSHYQHLLQGIFSSTDVFYYLLLTVSCLILSVRRLDAERLQD